MNANKMYDEYAETVYRFLLGMSHERDISEELTAETFYQAIKSQSRFDGTCKLSVWLCQIAKHLWYRELEKRRKKGTVPLTEDTAASGDSPETAAVLQSERTALYRAVHALGEIQREIVLLRLSGEFSFSEIGEIVGKSENYVRTNFYRAKEEIRRLINDQS
ncbi:MAG: sigma-70 family RNA polymerase sigma factor [Ruminococcus sp.]|nr:sigma-70 family RNA polymerase sigma factor [Ruminococcus sp.]